MKHIDCFLFRQITLEAASEPGIEALIGVDDLYFTDGRCPEEDLRCDFEHGMCFWDNSEQSDVDWVVASAMDGLLGPYEDMCHSENIDPIDGKGSELLN